MNKSPYDNLQVVTPHYVDVEIEDAAEVIPEKSSEPVLPKEKPVKPAMKTITLTSPPQYSSMSITNIKSIKQHVIPFEETLLVPDTKPDMAEVLLAEGRLSLDDSDSITFYTVYRSDSASDIPLEVIQSQIHLKINEQWIDSETSTYYTKGTLRNLQAQKCNERKFIAKGEIVLTVTELEVTEVSTFKGIGDPDLICRSENMQIAALCLEKEEITDISQEINVSSDAPAPVKLLQQSVEITESHRQVTSGKLVINGVITSRILYLGESDGENQLCSRTIKTDFTQFVPVTDSIDPELIAIDFRGCNLDIAIASNRQFMLQGQVKTSIYGYCHEKIDMVTDTYHKSYDVSFDFNETPLTEIKGTVSGEISSREVISLEDESHKPSRLLSGYYNLTDISAQIEGSRIIIDGKIPVKILALDADNVPFVIEASVPLRGSLEIPPGCHESEVHLTYCIRDFWFDEINTRQIEVNISAPVTIWMCEENKFTTLRNIALYETDDSTRKYSISLCVTGENDTLWHIAKRCKSHVDDIAKLNNIDPSGALPAGTKLLIMK